MTSLDDLTLLQWFVSGDATLEANQSLRLQPANNVRQLLGRKGSLLATAYDATTPARIEVRRHTDYTNVLHQVLIDHHFLPVGQGLDSQCCAMPSTLSPRATTSTTPPPASSGSNGGCSIAAAAIARCSLTC
ncbi:MULTISPECIES: hypothetical protein [Cyanophyceae]|nr:MULTISPECIES: hypothetical protein [Cyanophyceae]